MTATLPPTVFTPPIPRRTGRSRAHVLLSPVCPAGGVEPAGYLTHMERMPQDPLQELATIRWTLQALEVLAPEAFLLTFPSATALAHSGLEEELGHALGRPFLPALEVARMGRRRAELEKAAANARRLGLRLAVWGHRISSAGDFDALVVARRTAGTFLDPGDKPLIVTDITSSTDSRWATELGASMVEGAAVGDPIKVAPVDLNRLRR